MPCDVLVGLPKSNHIQCTLTDRQHCSRLLFIMSVAFESIEQLPVTYINLADSILFMFHGYIFQVLHMEILNFAQATTSCSIESNDKMRARVILSFKGTVLPFVVLCISTVPIATF